MRSFKKKLHQLVYSFSTEDRYADYDEEEATRDITAGVERSISESNHGSQIQLADYMDGSSPTGNEGISEALLAWRHVDNWTSEHNPDLAATLSDPCTRHDINNAEKDLGITFPASVRASLRIHDGQEDLESMTGTSGLFFGLQLMSLDQIVQMTMTWRNVADNIMRKNQQMQIQGEQNQALNGTSVDLPSQKQKGYGKLENQDYKAMNPNLQRNISQNYKKQFKLPDIPNQHSVPPLAIQPMYANPCWIPLVTDNAGNHVGIDLAPGPKGKYGQVILFGREFDTKFVVANNWGDFMLSFANDLELGNWLLIDEGNDQFAGEGELVFRDKANNGPVRDYLEVLVMRSRMKWKAFEKKLPAKPATEVSSSQDSQNTAEANQQQETEFSVDEKLSSKSDEDSAAIVDDGSPSSGISGSENKDVIKDSVQKAEAEAVESETVSKADDSTKNESIASATNDTVSEQVTKKSTVETTPEHKSFDNMGGAKNSAKTVPPKDDDQATKQPVNFVEVNSDSSPSDVVAKIKDDFENVAL